jgi:hypothetical protein
MTAWRSREVPGREHVPGRFEPANYERVALPARRQGNASRRLALCPCGYSAPRTLKFLPTKTWWGQLMLMLWTSYSPSLSCTTRSTMPPGKTACAAVVALYAVVPLTIVPSPSV